MQSAAAAGVKDQPFPRLALTAIASEKTKWNNKCTNEEDDGVDNGKSFVDMIGRARLPRRHRLSIDGCCAIVFVVRHRSA